MTLVVNGPTNTQNVSFAGPVTVNAGFTAGGSSFGLVILNSENGAHLILDGCGTNGLTLHGGALSQFVRLDNVISVGQGISVDGAFTNGIALDNVVLRTSLVGAEAHFDGVPDLYVDMTVIGARSVIFEDCDDATVNVRIRNVREIGVVIDGGSGGRFGGTVKNAGLDTTNTYDGVLVTGSAARNRTAFTVTYSGSGNQMRRGMTIDSGVNDHVEASILTGSGATADFADSGTGTVLTDDHIV